MVFRTSVSLTTVWTLTVAFIAFFFSLWLYFSRSLSFVTVGFGVVLRVFPLAEEVFLGASHAATVAATTAEISPPLRERYNADTGAFRFIRMFAYFATLCIILLTYLYRTILRSFSYLAWSAYYLISSSEPELLPSRLLPEDYDLSEEEDDDGEAATYYFGFSTTSIYGLIYSPSFDIL